MEDINALKEELKREEAELTLVKNRKRLTEKLAKVKSEKDFFTKGNTPEQPQKVSFWNKVGKYAVAYDKALKEREKSRPDPFSGESLDALNKSTKNLFKI